MMKMMKIQPSTVCMLAVLALSCLAASAQDVAQDPDPDRVRFVWDSPSIRFGRVLRIDFMAKLQGDWRGFSPHIETAEDAFDLHRARFGIEGNFLDHFEYQVEHEFREDFGGEEINKRWRDAYVNVRYFRDFQVRVGRFKVPFSLEQLTGTMNLDFIQRSLIADNLSPARDSGITIHGRVYDGGLSYEAGVFRHDGDNARPSDIDPPGGRTFAARVTGMPLRLAGAPPLLRDLELGAAVTTTEVPEGLSSLRGRANSGELFFRHVFVQGRRTRIGTELNWTPGPFSVRGEFIDVHEERKRQSIRVTDLPSVVSRGWYLSGTWAVTGEDKDNGLDPRRSFPQDGIGAVELAARYEQLRFGSSEHAAVPSRSQRAANIVGNSDRAWTFGLNWYMNPYVKIQVNGIRETIEDVERSPIFGQTKFWMGIVRLQFSL